MCKANGVIFQLYHGGKKINVKETRRGNQEWTIQIHWQHWVHKTQDEDNPDTLATLGTQDTGRRQSKHKDTTQKTKRRSNTDQKSGVSSCAREGYTVPASNNTSIVLLTYSRRVGHHYPLANTQIRMASSYTYLG